MKAITVKRLCASAGALCAMGALGLGATGSASAENERGTPTISMERDGNNLFFSGPDTVSPGSNLRIVNNTDPQQIGPHTFTLVKENLIPETQNEFRACFRGERDSVCRKVYKAHKVDFQKQEVGKVSVDDGKKGWNLLFRNQGSKGDSWFSDDEGGDQTRTVSAKPGKTLSYFCVIHPEMRGEIEVSTPVK